MRLRKLLEKVRFPLLSLHAERGDSGMVFPRTLKSEEEAALFRQMQSGDPAVRRAARDQLIEHNLRLVSHMVSKYAHTGGNGDDLFSIGCIGLIKAVESFSPEKKIRFSSYAAKCVQNEILMHFRAQRKSARDISLYDPIESDREGNPLTISDLLADEVDLCELVDLRLDTRELHRLVAALPEREQEVVRLRYGLGGQQPLTQQEVAKLLGISRSYVSRIEKKALERLRKGFTR